MSSGVLSCPPMSSDILTRFPRVTRCRYLCTSTASSHILATYEVNRAVWVIFPCGHETHQSATCGKVMCFGVVELADSIFAAGKGAKSACWCWWRIHIWCPRSWKSRRSDSWKACYLQPQTGKYWPRTPLPISVSIHIYIYHRGSMQHSVSWEDTL